MTDAYFTVEQTSTLISKRGALAIFAGDKTRKTADGRTVHSLRAPLLILPPDMFKDEEAVARKIADLLNQHAHLFFDSAKTEPVAG
jgi:hypothetical protein